MHQLSESHRTSNKMARWAAAATLALGGLVFASTAGAQEYDSGGTTGETTTTEVGKCERRSKAARWRRRSAC